MTTTAGRQGASICIIVPCFNEADRLDAPSFRQFALDNPHIHFLFVNDGSRDGTSHVLSGLSAEVPERIRALDLPRNSGKAEAIRTGANALAAWKAFDYAGFLDADLSAPLTVIAQLEEALATEPGYDLALGSRVALLGRTIRRNAARHYVGRVFATAVSLMLKLPVYDTQCGAKLFRARVIAEVFAEPFVTRWFFDVEMLFRLLRARGREQGARALVEVPLATWLEKPGTKLTTGDFVTTPIELYRIWRRYVYDSRA